MSTYGSHIRRFTPAEAKQWVKDHGPTMFVHAEDYEEAIDGYERWHKAYMALKYPDGSPPFPGTQSDTACEHEYEAGGDLAETNPRCLKCGRRWRDTAAEPKR